MLGERFLVEHGMNMAVARPADLEDTAEPFGAIETPPDALEAVGAPRNEVMPGRPHVAPAADAAGLTHTP